MVVLWETGKNFGKYQITVDTVTNTRFRCVDFSRQNLHFKEPKIQLLGEKWDEDLKVRLSKIVLTPKSKPNNIKDLFVISLNTQYL